MLTCAARDAGDPRLAELVDRLIALGDLAGMVREAVAADLWNALVDDLLVAARDGHPAVADLLSLLGRG